MNIVIRNLEQQVVSGLDDMARRRGLSREELVRTICRDAVETSGIKETENRYAALIKELKIVLEHNQDVISKNTTALETVIEKL